MLHQKIENIFFNHSKHQSTVENTITLIQHYINLHSRKLKLQKNLLFLNNPFFLQNEMFRKEDLFIQNSHHKYSKYFRRILLKFVKNRIQNLNNKLS